VFSALVLLKQIIMKTYFLPSLKLTVILIVICPVLYALLIESIGKLAPGGGDGLKLLIG